MLAIAIIVGVVFLAMYLMVWQKCKDLELDPRDEEPAEAEARVSAEQPVPGLCPLCSAPLRRVASREEIVSEIERRIDDETSDVGRLLGQPAPENIKRLYLA